MSGNREARKNVRMKVHIKWTKQTPYQKTYDEQNDREKHIPDQRTKNQCEDS